VGFVRIVSVFVEEQTCGRGSAYTKTLMFLFWVVHVKTDLYWLLTETDVLW